jgi:hypothetical protein
MTVLVRGGTYVLSEPLRFGPEDSGTKEHPVVYEAYPGEQPVLSSGRAIAGWKPGEGNRWVAKLPAGKGGPWRFTQLFVDVKRQTRARLPDTDDWNKWWRVAQGPNHPAVFRFPKDTLRNRPNVEDVEINLIPQYYRQNQIIALKAVDEKARTATLAAYPPRQEQDLLLEVRRQAQQAHDLADARTAHGSAPRRGRAAREAFRSRRSWL